jgi:hypothetical protein
MAGLERGASHADAPDAVQGGGAQADGLSVPGKQIGGWVHNNVARNRELFGQSPTLKGVGLVVWWWRALLGATSWLRTARRRPSGAAPSRRREPRKRFPNPPPFADGHGDAEAHAFGFTRVQGGR